MKQLNPSYPVIPTQGLVQLADFMKHVRRQLDRVRVPTLVVHSRNDHTAPYGSALEIHRRVNAAQKRLVTLEESYHLVAFDVDREQVASETMSFLTEACF